MIDLPIAKTLIERHRSLAEERWKKYADLHGLYACNLWSTTDTNAGLFGGRESIEDGSIYGIEDTKVSATTPLRPRIAVTPDILEEGDDELDTPPSPEAQADINTENKRRRRFATNRQRYLHHLIDENSLHKTLRRLNTLARIVPHAFLRSDWSFRYNRPMVRALSPLEVWCDEAQDQWDDGQYIIHVTFPRKHEIESRVQAGLYPRDLTQRLSYGPRATWSRIFKDQYKPDTFLDVVPVYEVFDLVDGRVLHMAEALPDEPLLEQDTPLYQFLRHPFHYLSFIDYLCGLRGLADAEVLEGPAQRLSRIANIEYFAAMAGLPQFILNLNAVDDPKVATEQWNKPRRPGSTLHLAMRQGMEDKLVGMTPTLNVAPALTGAKLTASADEAFRAGVPNYQRGEPEPRVAATYGALQQQAETTRRGWDIRLMQDCVVWCCSSFIALSEEFMPAHKVVTIKQQDAVGHPAGTARVWRASMDFRDPAEWAYAESIGQEPPDARSYFYSMEPFEDPMSKNPTAQIALNMQMLTAAATGTVPINPMSVVESLRQDLGRGPDFILQDWKPPAQAAAEQQAAAGGVPPAPGAADTVSAGGMPPGVAPVPTPAIGAMAGGAGAPAPVPPGAGLAAPSTFP